MKKNQAFPTLYLCKYDVTVQINIKLSNMISNLQSFMSNLYV